MILLLAAVSGAGESLTLTELIDLAVKNNPMLSAQRARVDAERARTGLLFTIDDTGLEFEYDGLSKSPETMKTIAISQEIPYPSKFGLRKKINESRAYSLEQNYREMELSVKKDIKDKYAELFLIGKKIETIKNNLLLMNQFITAANRMFSAGQGAQQDALKAQAEYLKISNELVLLTQEEKIAKENIKAILNRKDAGEIRIKIEELGAGFPGEIKIGEEEIIKTALENKPGLKDSKEMINRSEIEFALNRKEFMPDFMVKYKTDIMNPSDWSGMVSVTLPLWYRQKQNLMLSESKINIAQARAESGAVENMTVYEIKKAYAEYEAQKKLAVIYETGVLPQARTLNRTAQAAYETGRTGFLELLDSFRLFRGFELEYFETLTKTRLAINELEFLTGTELQGSP